MFKKFATLFLALAAACALTACVQPPTPFEEPQKPTFPTIPPVSIRDMEETDPPVEVQDEERVFVLKPESGKSYMMNKVFYNADGIVTHIYGEIYFQDKSTADLESLRNDVEILKGFVEEYDLSGMNVRIDEDEQAYFEVYHFLYLDEIADNAELAAAFVGFEAENGKISIDKAAQAMVGFGFTEE